MEKIEKIEKIKQFYLEARGELKKVTWPTRQQTISATWVVIIMTIVIAIFLGLVDLVLSSLIKYILR
ncbi:MAG TPA: preprotein translocase subunit SecE [Thermodesulfobacteriota bacterium]|nr:preprotein translocase subunit SecE [Thermodesulfobacteriota bacterium]